MDQRLTAPPTTPDGRTNVVSSRTVARKEIVAVLFRSVSTNVDFVGAFSAMDRARRFIESRKTQESIVIDTPSHFSVNFDERSALYTWSPERNKYEDGVLGRDGSQSLVVILAGHLMEGHRWLEAICPDFDSAERVIRKRCVRGLAQDATRLDNKGQPVMLASGYLERAEHLSFTASECYLDVPLWLPGKAMSPANEEQAST